MPRQPDPVTAPDDPPLTYHRDRCDGCGAPLEPGERLSGLCGTCQAPRPQEAPSK